MEFQTKAQKINTLEQKLLNGNSMFEEVYNLSFDDRKKSIMSLTNNTLMIDLKKEINRLDSFELDLIKSRAIIAPLTYRTPKTSNDISSAFLHDMNNKMIAFKCEYVMAKYLQEYFNECQNGYKGNQFYSNKSPSDNFIHYQTMFHNDIEEKFKRLKSLENFEPKDYFHLIESAGTGDYLSTCKNQTIETHKLSKLLDIEKEMKLNNIWFSGDKADFFFLDGTSLDFKTSLLNSGANSKMLSLGYQYNGKGFNSEMALREQLKLDNVNEYITNLTIQKYHSFISKNINNELNMFQNVSVNKDISKEMADIVKYLNSIKPERGCHENQINEFNKIFEDKKQEFFSLIKPDTKIQTDIKDIVAQTFYNNIDEKLYISSFTSKEAFKKIENLQLNYVGGNISTTLNLLNSNAMNPKMALRYINEYGAPEFSKIEKKDYLSYDKIFNSIYNTYDRNTYDGLNKDKVLDLNAINNNIIEIFNDKDIRELTKDIDLIKSKTFIKNLSNKQFKILNSKSLVNGYDDTLQEIKDNISYDITFFIHKEIQHKTKTENAVLMKDKIKELDKLKD